MKKIIFALGFASLLLLSGCGGGGGSAGGGGSNQSCSTTLKYIKSTTGTGTYTGLRIYNHSSIIITDIHLGTSEAKPSKLPLDPGDSYYYKNYVTIGGPGVLKIIDEEGCTHEKELYLRHGVRVYYELVDKI